MNTLCEVGSRRDFLAAGLSSFSLLPLLLASNWAWAQEKRPTMVMGEQPSHQVRHFASRYKNIYDAVGLEAKMVRFTAGPPQLAALQSGSIDITYMGMPPSVAAMYQIPDARFIMVESVTVDGAGIVVRRDAGIKTVGDLKGRSIYTILGSSGHLTALAAIRKAGYTPGKEVTVKPIGDLSVMFSAFIRGDIEAASFWEPWFSKLQEVGGSVLVTGRDVGIHDFSGYTANQRWLDQQPQAVMRFFEAMDRAHEILQKHRSDAEEILARALELSRSIAKKMLDEIRFPPLDKQVGAFDRGAIDIANVSMGTEETKLASPVAKIFDEQVVKFFVETKRFEHPIKTGEKLAPRYLIAYLKAKGRY